jgi:dienelactone hydrolase
MGSSWGNALFHGAALCGRAAAVGLLLVAAATTGLAQSSPPQTVEVPRPVVGKAGIVLKPVIHWPSGNGPFGIVVVVNSSAGKQDVFLSVTHPVMLKAGIAVAYLDTFTPRGVTDTVSEQWKVSSTEMAVDALFVADALRRDRRIRPDRVALQGQSKGAVTALHAATREWHSWAGITGLKPFDASIAFAPSCELQFREPELVSPLFAMLGEKDDGTLPGPCIRLFDRMKAAGQKITYEVVPGAVHSWSTSGYTRVDGFSARNCADAPLYYAKDGFVRATDGAKIAFSDVHRVCGANGYFHGGPADKRPYILDKAAAWLKQNGW